MTIESINKKDCCGCSLCVNVCVRKCISMQSDIEGFLVPVINKEECINCGLCYNKCPVNGKYETENRSRYFASAIANKKELLKSSSGGTFVLLARYILSQSGYVCGCVFDDNMKAVHICSNKVKDIYRMMGSKYVQSSLEYALLDVKRLLKDDKKVLFTGTACQIAAVKSLFPNTENLYLVDILCHGVPSPLFFRKYVEYLEKKHNGKLIKLEFRNKEKLGWGSEHRTYYEIECNGKIKGYRPILPAYFCSFFYGTNLRESSIASINTKKGLELFEAIRSGMSFCDEIPKDKGKGTNTNFYCPTFRYASRDNFYKGMAYKKYEDFIWRIYFDKFTRKKFITSIYGRFIPQKVKELCNRMK